MQQTEYVTNATEVRESESTSLTIPSTVEQIEKQWQQIGNNIVVFFAELPKNVGSFFQQYRQPIINFLLILAALIVVRVLFVVLAALNSIPLVAPTFQLIGIFYSVWFVNRYLRTKKNREELASKLQSLIE